MGTAVSTRERVEDNGPVTDPERGEGPQRRIPEATFAGDSGAASAEVTAALAAYARDRAGYAEVLAVLQDARLLVPVVAVLGEVEYDEAGLAHDKTSDMATVLLTGRDGRTALLAFTGTEQLQAWNPEARPVPVASRLAAQSAIQDGAQALVVDVAGPCSVVIEGDDLTGLAAGWRLGRIGDRAAWIRPPGE
jgi:hypothetical protein